jgi:hypothetical protein
MRYSFKNTDSIARGTKPERTEGQFVRFPDKGLEEYGIEKTIGFWFKKWEWVPAGFFIKNPKVSRKMYRKNLRIEMVHFI